MFERLFNHHYSRQGPHRLTTDNTIYSVHLPRATAVRQGYGTAKSIIYIPPGMSTCHFCAPFAPFDECGTGKQTPLAVRKPSRCSSRCSVLIVATSSGQRVSGGSKVLENPNEIMDRHPPSPLPVLRADPIAIHGRPFKFQSFKR